MYGVNEGKRPHHMTNNQDHKKCVKVIWISCCENQVKGQDCEVCIIGKDHRDTKKD